MVGTVGQGLPPVTHHPEEHEEQVDEIQVQRQRSPNRLFGIFLRTFVAQDVHFLDFLGIVSGEADKNQNSRIGNDPSKSRSFA